MIVAETRTQFFGGAGNRTHAFALPAILLPIRQKMKTLLARLKALWHDNPVWWEVLPDASLSCASRCLDSITVRSAAFARFLHRSTKGSGGPSSWLGAAADAAVADKQSGQQEGWWGKREKKSRSERRRERPKEIEIVREGERKIKRKQGI